MSVFVAYKENDKVKLIIKEKVFTGDYLSNYHANNYVVIGDLIVAGDGSAKVISKMSLLNDYLDYNESFVVDKSYILNYFIPALVNLYDDFDMLEDDDDDFKCLYSDFIVIHKNKIFLIKSCLDFKEVEKFVVLCEEDDEIVYSINKLDSLTEAKIIKIMNCYEAYKNKENYIVIDSKELVERKISYDDCTER